MLKINRKVEYALMTLKFMTTKKRDDLTSAREICERFKIPFDTTAKVMQQMGHHGILDSVQGVKGGYTLITDLSKISYMDLNRIIEGKSDAIGCENGRPCHLKDFCNIMGPVIKLNKKLGSYLEKTNLKELLES